MSITSEKPYRYAKNSLNPYYVQVQNLEKMLSVGIGEQVFIDPGDGSPVHPQFGFPDFKTDGGFYALPSSRFLTTISTGTGNADSASAPGRLPGMGTDVPYAGRR